LAKHALTLLDHFRQVGVTPQFSIIYLLLRAQNFIFGGSVMNSTIPADLLELEARFETWRTNRKYMREPIPDELWNAAADLSRRYPPSLVGRVLKIDPSRLKKFQLKRSARTSNRKKPQAAFFQLPTEITLPEAGSSLPQGPTGYRLQIERPDGSRLTLTLPSLELHGSLLAKLISSDGCKSQELN
jgi:hypothetical protein